MNSNSSGWYNYFDLFTSIATAQAGTLTSNHNMNSNSTGWYTYFDLFTSIATAQTGTPTSNL
jgi:hypothetical protein